MWGVFCEFKVRFSHSIARPWGLGGGCLLWVQSRIYVLLFSNAIFNHIITAPDCIKTLFLAIGISIIQGRWSWTHLTFIMLIIILVKLHLLSSWTKCPFCRPYLHMNLFNWNVCIVIENFSLTINQHYFSSFGHFCHGLFVPCRPLVRQWWPSCRAPQHMQRGRSRPSTRRQINCLLNWPGGTGTSPGHLINHRKENV